MNQIKKITIHQMVDSAEEMMRTWTREKQLNRLPHFVRLQVEALETRFF